MSTGSPLRFAVIGRGRMAATMRALVGDVPFDQAEAVYVACGNADHVRQSRLALEAGKPVLCEKPVALAVDDVRTLVALARSRGLTFMEAVATPFLPALTRAVAIVAEGRLGPIDRLEASFGYPVSREAFPRLFAPETGVLADRAVYPLMLSRILLGPVAEMTCEIERDGAGIDVAARLSLRHSAGARSDLSVSFVERLPNDLRIEGEAATLELYPPLLSAQRMRLRPAGVKRPSRRRSAVRQNPLLRRLGDAVAWIGGDLHPVGGSPYRHEIAHFTQLVRSRQVESPVVTHACMEEVVRLVEEARSR